MEHAISLFFRSIFVDNMIFAYFLGMCSYLAVSKNVKTSFGLGIAVTFVLLVTEPINYLLQTKVLGPDCLIKGVNLSYLSFILFIAVIAGIVQLVEMAVEKYSPSLYALLCSCSSASPLIRQALSLLQVFGIVLYLLLVAVLVGLWQLFCLVLSVRKWHTVTYQSLSRGWVSPLLPLV